MHCFGGEIKAEPDAFPRTRQLARSLMRDRSLSGDDRCICWEIASRPTPLTAPDAWTIRAIAGRARAKRIA